jgi:ABC-type sugar transport system substrate-binding protein
VWHPGVVALCRARSPTWWEAITRLEYSPNALTKSIFAGRSSTIGVVIRDLSSPFYLDLIRGIDEVAAANAARRKGGAAPTLPRAHVGAARPAPARQKAASPSGVPLPVGPS